MSTYQAASGAGQPGMDELREGTKELLATGKINPAYDGIKRSDVIFPERLQGVMKIKHCPFVL